MGVYEIGSGGGVQPIILAQWEGNCALTSEDKALPIIQ